MKAKYNSWITVQDEFSKEIIELKKFHFLDKTEIAFNEEEDEKLFFESLYHITDHTKISNLMLGVVSALGKGEYQCVAHCDMFEDVISELEFIDVDKMNLRQLQHYENAREYLEILWGWDIAF